MDDTTYLYPSFNPSSLKVSQLRGILNKHNVSFLSNAKKLDLLLLFNTLDRPSLLAQYNSLLTKSNDIGFVRDNGKAKSETDGGKGKHRESETDGGEGLKSVLGGVGESDKGIAALIDSATLGSSASASASEKSKSKKSNRRSSLFSDSAASDENLSFSKTVDAFTDYAGDFALGFNNESSQEEIKKEKKLKKGKNEKVNEKENESLNEKKQKPSRTVSDSKKRVSSKNDRFDVVEILSSDESDDETKVEKKTEKKKKKEKKESKKSKKNSEDETEIKLKPKRISSKTATENKIKSPNDDIKFFESDSQSSLAASSPFSNDNIFQSKKRKRKDDTITATEKEIKRIKSTTLAKKSIFDSDSDDSDILSSDKSSPFKIKKSPVKTTPAESDLFKGTPTEATPAESDLFKATPVDATPAESDLFKATPVDATPAESDLFKATPVDATPAESALFKETPAKPKPAKSASVSTKSTPLKSNIKTPILSKILDEKYDKQIITPKKIDKTPAKKATKENTPLKKTLTNNISSKNTPSKKEKDTPSKSSPRVSLRSSSKVDNFVNDQTSGNTSIRSVIEDSYSRLSPASKSFADEEPVQSYKPGSIEEEAASFDKGLNSINNQSNSGIDLDLANELGINVEGFPEVVRKPSTPQSSRSAKKSRFNTPKSTSSTPIGSRLTAKPRLQQITDANISSDEDDVTESRILTEDVKVKTLSEDIKNLEKSVEKESSEVIKKLGVHVKIIPLLFTILTWIFLVSVGLFGYWYHQQTYLIGYCGNEINRVTFPNTESQLVATVGEYLDNNLKPHCIPCPNHARCFPKLELGCFEDFVEYKPWNSFLFPAKKKCIPDTKKAEKLEIMVDVALDLLRTKNARKHCGVSEDINEAGVKLSDLHDLLLSMKAPYITTQEFEELWGRSIIELEKEPDIIVGYADVLPSSEFGINDTETGAIDKENKILRSTSLSHISLTCQVRNSVIGGILQYKYNFVILFIIASLLKLIQYKFKQRKFEKIKVDIIVKEVTKKLQYQFRLYNLDTAKVPYVGSIQLRDLILANENNLNRRVSLWNKVVKKVEHDTNIQSKIIEDHGEIIKVWQWVSELGH